MGRASLPRVQPRAAVEGPAARRTGRPSPRPTLIPRGEGEVCELPPSQGDVGRRSLSIRAMARPPLLNAAESDFAYAAAQCVVETHRRLVSFVRRGHTLAEVDAEVARIFRGLGCRSCFLGYRVGRLPAFPSHACLSVNDCIVHGTAASHTEPLKEGDLFSIDIGVWHKGWIGDAAWTYAIGSVSEE
ncbi:MAG TPA: hypothetical protein DEB06_09505, partial [Phycisphaerales bacterium]|nr:hypothetical protein [Phycisphaerales bacterium]